MTRLRTIALCDAEAARQIAPWRGYSCGHCGETFKVKADKLRHKRECAYRTRPVIEVLPEQPCADEDLYTDMRRHSSPFIKALAAAEWEAMDERGNLPADWPERRAEIVRQFWEAGK